MTEWEALKEECLRCQACTLAATRTNVVFGVGVRGRGGAVYRRGARGQ